MELIPIKLSLLLLIFPMIIDLACLMHITRKSIEGRKHLKALVSSLLEAIYLTLFFEGTSSVFWIFGHEKY